jgi:PAS domain S-box-containing protein
MAIQRQPAEADIEGHSGFAQENPNPVFRISTSGLLLYANPASSRLLAIWGWAVGQIVTHDWQDWIAVALASGADKEFEIQATDRILALNLHPLGPAGYVNVYGHDVTQLRQAEKSLHASQEWLASIFDTASEAIISTDEQQRILLFNKAAETIFGYRSEEVLGQPLSMLLPDRFREIHSREMHTFGAAPEQAHNMGGLRTVVGRRKDGTEFSLQAGISKTSNEGPMTFTFIGTDMTERQRAEQSLRDSERRYRSLFENMLDGYALCQMLFDDHQQPQDFIYLEVNHGFETLTGLTEVVGKKVTEVIPGIKQSNPELFEIYGRVAATGSPERFETYLEALGRAWLSVSAYSPARGYFVAVFDNITERKRADEALRNSEQRYRSLFDDSPIALWEEDYSLVKQRLEALRQQGVTDFRAYFENHPAEVAECAALIKVLDVNQAAMKLQRASSKDELLQGLSRVFGPETYPVFTSELVNVAQGRRYMQWEEPGRTLAGDPIFTSLHWSTVPGYEASLSRVIVSSVDITERVRADEMLRASERRYRGLFEDSPIGLWEEDHSLVKQRLVALQREGHLDLAAYLGKHPEVVAECASLIQILEVNSAALKLYGVSSKADLLGALQNLVLSGTNETFLRQLVKISRGETDFELEGPFRTLTGEPVQVSLRWSALPGHEETLSRVLITAIDMTERERAAETLAQERNLLRTLIDNLPDAVYVKDNESRYVIKNLADARKMGAATPDETIGKTDFDYYPAELAARYQADDRAVLDSGRAIINREEPITEATGRAGWVSTTKVPLRNRQGKVIGLVGIGHDITEQKRANEALRQSQSDLETAQALAHLGSWTRDASSDLTVWSKEMFRLHYLSPAEESPSFEAYIETIHPDDRTTVSEHTGALVQGVDHSTCLYRTNPVLGPERVLELNLHTARDDLGQALGWHGTAQDVTERKQRLAELEAVNRVSSAMRAAQTLDQLLSEWLDVTLAITHASGGSIWLYDRATDELRPAVLRGWAEPAGAEPVRPQRPGEGINGQVYRTGQPYTSSNFHDDPSTATAVRERIPSGGGVCVPIRAQDQVIGTFVIYLPQPRPATPGEVQLVSTLCEIAGNAIQRMHLHEQTKQQLSRMTALRSVDQAISSSLDLQVTLTVLLDQATTQLAADAADVLLLDAHDQTLSYAAGRGFRTDEFQRTRTRVGEGRAGRAVLERRIVVSDLHADQPASKRTGLLARDNFVSYLGVPLIAKDQVLGVLEIFHRSPLDPAPEWLEFLSALASQAAIALDNAALYSHLQRANAELALAYDATIEGWSRALDLRDKETEGHSQRVTRMTLNLGRVMGLSEEALVHVRRGALLHDIGKMGVPDRIMLKPGPLTDDEWVVMKKHPTFAYEMLSPIHYLRSALEIPYCHHEKWDGTGYPRGLRGEKIPLAARIFAVVDVWDALSSDRPYRPAWPEEKVREYVREQAGKHFDPQMVETFLRLLSPAATLGDS